jgi:1-pyrroline-4-hydroxy-2-carboxylate deaminase
MEQQDWTGVFPAITTPFRPDLTLDGDFLYEHVAWLVDHGCKGIVTPGSLGEGATLNTDEKVAILRTCRRALGERVPLIAAVSALSTSEAVSFARAAADTGCDGLMVLPPYVYRGDAHEMAAHVSTVIEATTLSCMLYNNPIAYGTDYLPEQIARLGDRHGNLHAVKESSGDVRRITAIRAMSGERFNVFVGLDDLVVEGVAAGAVGWIAGLANALPRESVRLFELAASGDIDERHELYQWFLPLLRLDTVPKFVQLIKLVQLELELGSDRVRPPRLPLTGSERTEAVHLIRQRLVGKVAGFAGVRAER